MKKETFKKIDKNTFKRIMDVEKEDVFKKSHLEQEKRDLEEQIATPQKRLNEVNHILDEINQLKQGK